MLCPAWRKSHLDLRCSSVLPRFPHPKIPTTRGAHYTDIDTSNDDDTAPAEHQIDLHSLDLTSELGSQTTCEKPGFQVPTAAPPTLPMLSSTQKYLPMFHHPSILSSPEPSSPHSQKHLSEPDQKCVYLCEENTTQGS
jgi:hypothetical protein